MSETVFAAFMIIFHLHGCVDAGHLLESVLGAVTSGIRAAQNFDQKGEPHRESYIGHTDSGFRLVVYGEYPDCQDNEPYQIKSDKIDDVSHDKQLHDKIFLIQ